MLVVPKGSAVSNYEDLNEENLCVLWFEPWSETGIF